ncbi:hypothetical protein LIA77_04248 [Sarocladium implicatum]|nr:hypothetical protein LIA77_04248 [Sarocladium implicatum]
MPRPRRAPRAPAAPAPEATESPVEHTHDDEMENRGRTRSTRNSARVSDINEAALRIANKSRDAALERLANEDPTTEDNTISSVEVGRRGLGTPLRAADTTGLDLGDDMFGDLDESFDLGGDSLLKAPQSADSSTLSLRNLGRRRSRSRQSSFIGRNDAPIRPSSRNGATPLMSSSFNIGVFRRRAREPSILGTNRKSRYDTTGSVTGSVAGSVTGSVAGSVQGSDVGSDRELSPEAESTPLNERRRSTRSQAQATGGREVPIDSSVVPYARKRKSGEDLETSERPEKTSRVGSHGPESDGSESESELSSLGSPVLLPTLRQERPVTPTRDEDVAPPASSDSETEEIWPDIHALAKRRRRPSITTPGQLDRLSDVSSPPSLTHSPNFKAVKRGKAASRRARANSPELTTAHLANLLPKRRVKKTQASRARHAEEEVDTSGLAQDDDELAHLDAQTSRRTRSTRAAARNDKADNALQPRQTPAGARPVTRSSSRAGKTYSRRSSDKENQQEEEEEEGDEEEPSAFVALPDDTFGEAEDEGYQFTETEALKAQAKKFKEVDSWELSFEEVVEAEEVAPQDAR